ncbi:MAG: hypothetical protein M0Z85_05385 [Gammaproteobacteria bacterium]|nr:hypothetical protein [Gammaproteobacteria bacterium]
MTTTRRSIIEWEQIFREQEASGESVKIFCARHGISLSPFYRYHRRLRAASRTRGASQPAFVPVAITPRGPQAPVGPTADHVTLTVGKASLTLSSSVSPAWVAALLTALEA